MSEYRQIIVESYYESGSGLHGDIHIRPAKGQYYPQNLRVECSKRLRLYYPVGTQFLLKVKLTNKEDGIPFLYSSYKWNFIVL